MHLCAMWMIVCTYVLICTSGAVRSTFETRGEVRSRSPRRDPGTANNWKRRQSSRYSWQRNRSSQHEERAISNHRDGNKQPRTWVVSKPLVAGENHATCHRSSTIERFYLSLQLVLWNDKFYIALRATIVYDSLIFEMIWKEIFHQKELCY